MFTGIVTDIGTVVAIAPRAADLRRLTLSCSYDRAGIADGASIACSGTCLTVVAAGVEHGRTWFSVDAAAETLRLTTVGRWTVGTRVNLERALKIGDELGGHLVTGHVDGLAELIARRDLHAASGSGEMVRMTFRAPTALARFIATKGSVTLAGVSLTVNEVAGDTFSVLLIPHTLQVTTLGDLAVGDPVNLEVDLMARYAARLAEAV
ncbi:riboflavin synthase [Rhodoplanes serenus]|jgi:riboflavin synthase|uniref:Riboflavin synthase n=1 Tax=Rhodoplanes serenus TaxID=200615 RepID=A0A327JVX7_9BRAD|nr:riboflavin synthase [Rhodoplanes serenus]MBI5114333.1 riboflavin synthase [Rhodovulum sp.]MTW15628.1 riboflavin synthase [Rhodoplanes serenus]RAI30639.1 riboflavin synthase [Rhodoplanes serenus]VCU07903.1 Riboflavin synthase [Rhodoplanes serenus]